MSKHVINNEAIRAAIGSADIARKANRMTTYINGVRVHSSNHCNRGPNQGLRTNMVARRNQVNVIDWGKILNTNNIFLYGNSKNYGESTDNTAVLEQLDIDAIPLVAEDSRWRRWMQLPTMASELSPEDILVQEAELVRHYLLEDVPIELAVDAGAGNPCTVCVTKQGTRAMMPCGHHVCVNCMTLMVNSRVTYKGETRPKSCSVCRAAIGFFLRV